MRAPKELQKRISDGSESDGCIRGIRCPAHYSPVMCLPAPDDAACLRGGRIALCSHTASSLTSMPKLVVPPLPLSGLFAVSKPSGPTSMSVLEDIKQLVCNSRLFVDARKLENRPRKDNKRRKRDVVKIGQGGTLDPLADGVLGIIHHYLSYCYVSD